MTRRCERSSQIRSRRITATAWQYGESRTRWSSFQYTPYGEVTVQQAERDQGGSVKAEADRRGDAGIRFHYTDPNSAYRMRYDTANESIVLSSVTNWTWNTKATYYFEPAVGDDVSIVIGYDNDTPCEQILAYLGGTQRINQTAGTDGSISGTDQVMIYGRLAQQGFPMPEFTTASQISVSRMAGRGKGVIRLSILPFRRLLQAIAVKSRVFTRKYWLARQRRLPPEWLVRLGVPHFWKTVRASGTQNAGIHNQEPELVFVCPSENLQAELIHGQ